MDGACLVCLEQREEGIRVPERFRSLRFRRRLGCWSVSVKLDNRCAVLFTLRAGRLQLSVTGSVPVPVAVRAGRLRRRVTSRTTSQLTSR